MNVHPSSDVAEQSECSSPEHMESYTAKDYGNEKGSAAPEVDVDQDVFMIEVRGFHTSTNDDTIESFFDNKKRSGGGDIKNIVIDRTNAVIHIIYREPGVAQNVFKKDNLQLEGATLMVQLKSSIPLRQQSTNQDKENEKQQELQIVDEYSNRHTTERHERQDCEEELSTLDIPPDDSEETYAKEHWCSNTELTRNITSKRFSEQGGSSWYTSAETTNTPTSNRATVDLSSAQILDIRGFKPDTVRENVEMFLQNTYGETELQSLDYNPMTGVAIATFKNAEGATKLMAGRNLQLDGCQLSIVRLMDIYAGLDREACRPRAVQVEGIKQGTSQELLQLFFENRRQSGGGEIEQLDYDTDEDTAIIIFTAADSASRVAQKGSLVIEGTRVQVKLMTPPKSMPVLQGPFEDNLVLVSGLSSSCNGNDLKSFFSAVKTNCEIERVIFSLHPRVAMLQFTNQPDILRMRELCVTKPLRGSMLSVQRVPQSTTIQVHNIGDVSEQMLMLYFESKRSGGATVTDIKIIPEEHYALITFSECSSVQNVLAKPHHQVNKQDLHVEPFYECLGLIPPYYDTTMPGGWIPNNMVVTGFSSRVFSFLQTSDVSRRLVDTEMAKVAAVVEWRTYDDTSISVEMTCAITNTTKDAQRKAKTWSQDVSKKFLEVLETNFASDYIQTLQEAWQLFRKIISYVDELDPSMTTVDISDDACTICVTGQRTEVVNLSAKLDKDYSKVQEEMNRAATIITETTSRHKLHQLRMLHAKAFASQLQKKFKDMKVVIDIQSQEVKFTGMPGDVMQAKLEMLEIFNKMSELKLDMSPSLINMLNGKGMRKHVVDEFRNKNICAVFNDVGGDKLGVYALSDDDVCAAVEVIKATTCEISVDAAINKMADPEKWTKLIKNQQSQHVDLLEISVSGTAVRLVGAKSRVDAALEVIKTFLKDNIISEQFVPMEHGVASYIDKYMRNKTEKIMQDFRHSAVKITVSLDGPYGYTVSGNSYGLQNAVQQVLKIPDEVRIQQLQVDEPGMPKFLQSVSGQHSLDTLGKRHNVVIEPVGKYVQKEDLLTSKADHSAASDGFVSRVTLPGGATVEVIRGDMTKFQSDAIVNAANGQLEHWGGLARAIADAGGQEIQLECRNHVQRNGVLADGQVYVSTAGRLPCKKVIHAVGPIWKDGLSNEENNLFDAVFESLLAAQQCNLSSVAIPALSSGIFGFPIVKCTMIIVSAIKDFFDTETHSSVKKVSLMDPKQDVVQTFHQSLCTVFGPKVVTTSENRQGNSQKKAPRPTPRRKEQNLMLTSMTYSRTEKQTTRHTKEKSTPVKVNHRTAEGIVLILHKSEIANEKVDAIINSTSRDLQLTRGAVSQTLLQKGGNVIQMECQENAPDGIKFAEVVVTSGGSLNCSHIVHGACCSWDGGKGQSEQVLRQLLTNCFEMVHQLKLTSVAFPAIGTGQLGFPHQLVATVMLDELHQFSSRHPQTSLRDVRFVVYHKDQASIQAFEKVLEDDEAEELAEEKETRPARAFAKPEQGAVGGTTSHKENEMIHIGSIDVDIVHGDLTKEETDAIVNSTNKDLDLIGATTKAIIEAGGPLIAKEMRKIGKVGSSGIAVTTAGRLPCAHIIHIDAPKNDKSDWTTIIERALLQADSLEIESIALPALGTGALGLKPSTMAAAMLDAIERFTKRNPESTLKLVKIVIFQQSMMDSFRKSAYEKASGKKGWLSSMIGCVKGFLFGEDTVAFTKTCITLNIFGKSSAEVNKAKKNILHLCKTECDEIILNDEKDQASITKMTSTQTDQIRTLENSLDVSIIITTKKADVSIRIRGMPADTRQAQAEIVNIFRKMEMEDKDKALASVYATQVQWKYAKGQGFADYPEAINGLLESAFQSKKHQVHWKEDTGDIYYVTFKNMKETSKNSHTGVDVERHVIDGKMELPAHWSAMGKDEFVKLKPLNSASAEYKKVEKTFLGTAQTTVSAVIKIARVQNPSLYRQYKLRKDEMEGRIKQPTAIEQNLWHGTSADAIKSINNSGFNRSYCGKNATIYGQGVYFAVGASYSANNQYATPDVRGHKHIYQALVLTGAYTTGNSSYRVPPPNPANPDFPFDSVVDNINSPGIFVIFLDNQAYPEYLITFT